MERPIMKDPIFLAQKSERATADDLDAARDLLDTLKAHREGCVGMAANMIGIAKRIIVFVICLTGIPVFVKDTGLMHELHIGIDCLADQLVDHIPKVCMFAAIDF